MQHVDEGRLHAWLDGELPDGERWVERHLEECEACRARAAEERRIRDAASSILGRADPGEVAPRRIVPLPAARRRRPWVAVGWAASVLLALGIGWMARPAERQTVAVAPVTAPRAPASAAPAATNAAPPPAEPVAQTAPAAEERVAQAPAPRSAPRARARSDEAGAPAPVASVAVAVPAPELAPPPPPPPSMPLPPPAAEVALDAPPVARRSAGDTLTVRGRVTDAQGQALSGVQVTVPALALRTVTRADGSYALALPAARVDEVDSLRVRAARVGMRAQTRSFAAGAETIDFKLAPEALALEGLVVNTAERGAGAWRASAQAAAERHLRDRLVIVPGLPVVGIEVGRVDGRAAARVRQRLPGGEILTLTQRRAASRADTTSRDSTIVVRRGSLRVEASAPIPADSLRALLF